MFIADVSDQRSLQRGVASVEQEVGAVDLLINNAGVVGPIQPTWEVESDQWRHTFEVNLFGAFACIQAVLPGMVTRKRGRIINISSGAAYNIFPYLTAYATSKAALTHLTKCLAAETKEYGISVFAYNPGFIRTGMLEWAAASAEVHDLSRGIFNKVLEEGQARPVEQVIPMFMFLASGKADVFSGRYFTSLDNPDELAQRTEEILRDNLFTLDLRK